MLKLWQRGSKTRDLFKLLHKHYLPSNCYALNSDLELVEKKPVPFIAARLDFKLEGDSVSFAEVIAYNQLIQQPAPWRIPVYLVEALRPFDDGEMKEVIAKAKAHRFRIYEYLGGDPYPSPPIVKKQLVIANIDWNGLREWETRLRERRRNEMERYLSMQLHGH